jgi:hypothetical protein
MNLKVECSCGARFSFDVEPRDSRMPSPVQCPICQADATDAANKLIVEQMVVPPAASSTRLRLHSAPSPQTVAETPSTETGATMCAGHPLNPAADYCVVCQKPICTDCMATFGYLCSIVCRNEAERARIKVPAFHGQRSVMEAAAERRGLRLTWAIVLLAVLVIGSWAWYAFYGSKPQLSSWLKMTETGPAHVQFYGPDKILIVTANEAALHDLDFKKILWSAKLSDGASAKFPAPQVVISGLDLWICLGSKVVRLNAADGAITQTIPVQGDFVSFGQNLVADSPADVSVLVVSALDETNRIALHINTQTGETSRQQITVPRRQIQTLSDDLPPNVAPTAGVLLAQALDEQKLNQPLDAVSSEFFSTGNNLAELRVKLLETKLAYVQSIKPAGASQLNGQTTAATGAGDVAEELFNDIKRNQTGGVKRIDQSRYEVRLRRWISDQPIEWKGEVNGAPSFFPLSTVDLLTAGNALFVFDKQNNKLFESKLTYPIGDAFTKNAPARQALPAAERDGRTLYFFDQGVLTAFALPSGDVRWRLTSFGIKGIQFDEQGMLFVNSTTAGPEDIQYSDTVRVEKIHPILLKVDPSNGKIIWKAEGRGEHCLISGKYIYAESIEQGGFGIADALGDALNAPQNNSVAFHLYRIDPANGEAMWDMYYPQQPENLAVENNRILLRLGDNLELFKYLSF